VLADVSLDGEYPDQGITAHDQRAYEGGTGVSEPNPAGHGPRSADNCILRRLELDASGRGQGFVDAFAGVPTAGFHTYGETWLGHVNQTLTGVIFG